MIVMVCAAPAGAPFYSDPHRGLAALTPGYYLSPLRGLKNYAASGVSPALPAGGTILSLKLEKYPGMRPAAVESVCITRDALHPVQSAPKVPTQTCALPIVDEE